MCADGVLLMRNSYPWRSAHVITTIVIGFLLLVGFFVYEVYVPLKEYVQ